MGKADFINGEIRNDTVISAFGTFPLPDFQRQETGQVELMVRPDDVFFSLDVTGESTITEARFLGASVLYRLQFSNGPSIHAIRPSTEIYPVGARVRVKLDARHIVIFSKTCTAP